MATKKLTDPQRAMLWAINDAGGRLSAHDERELCKERHADGLSKMRWSFHGGTADALLARGYIKSYKLFRSKVWPNDWEHKIGWQITPFGIDALGE